MRVNYDDDESADYGTSDFKVIVIDVERGRYGEVKSLGNMAIFVGYSAPLSLDTILFILRMIIC